MDSNDGDDEGIKSAPEQGSNNAGMCDDTDTCRVKKPHAEQTQQGGHKKEEQAHSRRNRRRRRRPRHQY